MEIKNRSAFHEYFIDNKYVAGMVLTGTEVKSLRTGKASFNDSYCIIHKGELANFSDEAYSLRFGNKSENPPRISFHVRDTTGSLSSAEYYYYPEIGAWHQVTVTGGINSQMTIYIDGLPYSSLNTGASNVANSNGSLQIGCQLPSTLAYCFNGRIDEVRLYKRFMPATEIKALYDALK